MIILNGKEYRNLQEQVRKNKDDIEEISLFDIVGEVNTAADLPEVAEKGNVYVVGLSKPFEFYMYIGNGKYKNLGTLASLVPGPKGDKGDAGLQGERGSRWTVGTVEAEVKGNELEGDMYLDILTGGVYRFNGSFYVMYGSIKGKQGVPGPKGPTYDDTAIKAEIDALTKAYGPLGERITALNTRVTDAEEHLAYVEEDIQTIMGPNGLIQGLDQQKQDKAKKIEVQYYPNNTDELFGKNIATQLNAQYDTLDNVVELEISYVNDMDQSFTKVYHGVFEKQQLDGGEPSLYIYKYIISVNRGADRVVIEGIKDMPDSVTVQTLALGKIDAADLVTLMEGSDDIVVDLNPTSTAVEVHLDQTYKDSVATKVDLNKKQDQLSQVDLDNIAMINQYGQDIDSLEAAVGQHSISIENIKGELKNKLDEVPQASATVLGGVKIGSGITIAQDGTISAAGGGGGGADEFAFNPYDVSIFVVEPDYRSNKIEIGAYNAKVDWGDGNQETLSGGTLVSHTYDTSSWGRYIVRVKGYFSAATLGRPLRYAFIASQCGVKPSQLFWSCDQLEYAYVSEVSTSDYDANLMFYGCRQLKNIAYLGHFGAYALDNLSYMFGDCASLQEAPLFRTRYATNMNGMFKGCENLVEIPAYDVASATDLGAFMDGCTNIQRVHLTNINTDLDISASTLYSRGALNEVIDNLKAQPEGTTKTLTVGATNLAKLKPEDIAVATEKNWNIV